MADLRNIRLGHKREAEIGKMIRDVFQERVSEEEARKFYERMKPPEIEMEREARVEEERIAREEERVEEERMREEEFVYGEGPGIGASVSGKASIARSIAVGAGIAATGALIYIFFLM